MSSKRAVWLAFFLNLSFAIVEFIAGGIFGSSAVLADSVHDLGDALAIGLSAFLETISNRQEDSRYTLGYKRFSLLGALVTAVISQPAFFGRYLRLVGCHPDGHCPPIY